METFQKLLMVNLIKIKKWCKKIFTLISLKNSNSVNKFKIKTKLKNKKKQIKKILKKIFIINFI